MYKILVSMLLAAGLGVPAFAGSADRVVVTPAAVRVGVTFDPWSPHATPPPRPGYTWVRGYYVGRDWRPGYWRPVEVRRGYTFEPGYWREGIYTDGYWRPVHQHGWYWVRGHYAGRGWIPGHWVRR